MHNPSDLSAKDVTVTVWGSSRGIFPIQKIHAVINNCYVVNIFITFSIPAILFKSYIIKFAQIDQQPCSNSPPPTRNHN